MSIHNVDDLRERLRHMTPAQLRHIANMGKLHAKLAKKAQKKHGLTVQERALMNRLEQNQLGLGAQ